MILTGDCYRIKNFIILVFKILVHICIFIKLNLFESKALFEFLMCKNKEIYSHSDLRGFKQKIVFVFLLLKLKSKLSIFIKIIDILLNIFQAEP